MQRLINLTLPFLWWLALTACPALDGPAHAEEGQDVAPAKWTPLFNGKDLSGWTVKIAGHAVGDNVANTFRVEDGLLKVSYDGYKAFDGKFGHLFHTPAFSNYRLRAEYRFVGEQAPGAPGWAFRNSGLMLHGQSAESMGLDQRFPISIEVQLLGGGAQGERPTANLCTPGTDVVLDGKLCRRHCVESKSKTYRGDQWVTVEVEVRGNRIRHLVDGETVLAYMDPQLDDRDAGAKKLLAAGQSKMLRGGTISLQAESHPIHFRKIEIMELPAPAAWIDLLPGGAFDEHWETQGNWHRDGEGIVSLTPREGEQGWSRFDAYLWSKVQYKDFEIEFDYRVQPKSNSGFYFHVGDKARPIQQGLEVQIYDSHGKEKALNDHDAGGIIPGIPPSQNAAKPAGEWNHFRINCVGKDLTVELNGVVVNRIQLDRPNLKGRPSRGYIGFQDHALPLSLRSIRIRSL